MAEPTGKYRYSTAAVTGIAVTAVLGVLAWLATAVVWLIGTAPSGSPSENMNGVVLFLLPIALPSAGLLSAISLGITAINTRSTTTRAVAGSLGMLFFMGSFLGAAWIAIVLRIY